jgi:hypothetical protein
MRLGKLPPKRSAAGRGAGQANTGVIMVAGPKILRLRPRQC